jgi:hypothetical protein
VAVAILKSLGSLRGGLSMNVVSTLLPSVLGCLTIAALVEGGGAPKDGVIDVQVTGRLVTVGQKGEGEAGWTVTAYVHAEGRDLLLDCSANESARKLIKAEFGNPDALTSSGRPVRNVKVKGQLKFRSDRKRDNQGDSIPVIVVESLKLVGEVADGITAGPGVSQ